MNFSSAKNRYRLTISSWWHVALLIGALTVGYIGLKTDSEKALALSMEKLRGD